MPDDPTAGGGDTGSDGEDRAGSGDAPPADERHQVLVRDQVADRTGPDDEGGPPDQGEPSVPLAEGTDDPDRSDPAETAEAAEAAEAPDPPNPVAVGEDPVDEEDVYARPPIDPRIRQRRVAIQRSQGRKRLLWLAGATGLLVLVVLVVALAHTPWFGARAITVTGAHPRTTEGAIVAAAGLEGHPPLISVNPGAVARRVESLPFIATARVARHWPDGVQIAVTERDPVVQMAGPGTSWSLLDGQGRTLQQVPGRVPGIVVYIVHTAGAGVPPAPVGSSLPPSAGPGLEVSRTLPPAFVGQVVSVTVAADGSISLALESGVTVLFGTDADRVAKYKDIAAILANGTLHATSVIDVTVPESPTVSG